jgi:hypothetical protein
MKIEGILCYIHKKKIKMNIMVYIFHIVVQIIILISNLEILQ